MDNKKNSYRKNGYKNEKGWYKMDYFIILLILGVSFAFYSYTDYGVPNILLGVSASITAGIGAFKEFFKTASYFGFGGNKK